MANSDKDILITPNKGTTSLPELSFIGQVNSPIKLRVLDDNTLSFEGSAGQLFSINNNLTTGTIFAVSDVSGVPSLSVDASGYLNAVPFNGVLTVGSNNSTYGNTAKVAAEIRGRASGGEDPVALSTTPNGSLIISTAGTGVFAHMGIQANTTPQYAWLQVRHSTNGSAYNYTLQPLGGYTGFYEKPISRVSIATDGTGGDSRQLTIYNKGQALLGFGSYPGAWSPALMIQNNDNTNFIWLSPIQSGSNNRLRASPGLDIYVGSGIAVTGTLGLQVDASANVGVKGTTNASYALNVTGDVNFSGNLYQGGSIFKTLPNQSATTIGSILKSDGTNAYWAATSPEDLYLNGFQISRGYAMAGYQNSTSYRNVCSINHSAITLTNHGDLLTNGQGYCAGGRDKLMYGYVFIAVNGVGGTGTSCSKINMNNDTNGGTTNISINRSSTTIMQRDFRFAYVYGGGDSRPDKFNYTNNSSALISNGNPEGNVNNPAGGYGAQYGWTKNGAGYNFSWATESYSTWSGAPGTDGSNKTLSARGNFAYWNTAGGYTTSAPLSKRNLLTGIEIGTISNKPNQGEETWHTGMTKGFLCGMYNGAQNNQGAVVDYSSDTFTNNAAINRVGPPGSASGAGTEFGTLATGYDGI